MKNNTLINNNTIDDLLDGEWVSVDCAVISHPDRTFELYGSERAAVSALGATGYLPPGVYEVTGKYENGTLVRANITAMPEAFEDLIRTKQGVANAA